MKRKSKKQEWRGQGQRRKHTRLQESPRINLCQTRGVGPGILIKSALEQLHRVAPSCRLTTMTPNVESKAGPHDTWRWDDEIRGQGVREV